MKMFKFFGPRYEIGGFVISPEIIDMSFEFCRMYNHYVNLCREDYLNNNPDIDRNGHYTYPIPYNEISFDFPEGKLWHGGSDYYEDEDKMMHFVYLDRVGNGEVDDFFIEIVEMDNGEFYVEKIDTDRSRWD
jgi:hypothetical protein